MRRRQRREGRLLVTIDGQKRAVSRRKRAGVVNRGVLRGAKVIIMHMGRLYRENPDGSRTRVSWRSTEASAWKGG